MIEILRHRNGLGVVKTKLCDYCGSCEHRSTEGYVSVDRPKKWYCSFQCQYASKYGNKAYFKPGARGTNKRGHYLLRPGQYKAKNLMTTEQLENMSSQPIKMHNQKVIDSCDVASLNSEDTFS